MSKEEHTHKFKRIIMGSTRVERGSDGKKYLVKQSGYPVYKCMIPGCPTYIAREMVEGRKCICWRCGGELVMSPYNMRQVKPVHRACTRKVGSA